MAANLSKKFELLISCLMTMQALRLVISTAGFCVVRFHIDCELFNIFISRLVNAVLMSQLFGNWIGDLFVFAFDGKQKLIALAVANWVEFCCFCSALICICHTECGHLTGFYWSMVLSYFWWKVGEAPTVSIAAPDATDYFFAGFTLSGVWASCLKGLVMWFVAGTGSKSLHFNSDPLGDVNVKVVGARSVKTTVDYRAAKWLFILTITLTAMMCLPWTVVAVVLSNGDWREADTKAKIVVAKALVTKLKKQAAKLAEGETGTPGGDKNRVAKKIRTMGDSKNGQVSVTTSNGGPKNANFGNVTVDDTNISVASPPDKVQIQVGNVEGSVKTEPGAWNELDTDGKTKLEDKAKVALFALLGETDLMMASVASVEGQSTVTIKLDVKTAGVLKTGDNKGVAVLAALAFGGVLAVPGAMLGAGVGWAFGKCCCLGQKKCQLIFGIVGALGGMAAGVAPCVAEAWDTTKGDLRIWVEALKWPLTNEDKDVKIRLAALIGLGAGLGAGWFVGVFIASCNPLNQTGPVWAGMFFGSFFGLISGEIVNGNMTSEFAKDWKIVGCGFFIVVCGLGTVYSIYPGMAPCSITQFKYFNIIDISILILSSFAPLIIMGLDLADVPDKLGLSIVEGDAETQLGNAKWVWCGLGLVLTICTLICEIIVLHIMHHPFSKMTQKVTTKPTIACFITITMVTFQLVSTGIGFGCVAAGSTFNDGVNNVLSTLVLWTTECCGVLGEGYLTELKKYEPGKWPTQGMGKWATYKWWNGKAFGNAWRIWCCIGTTDLRRDIMLCRQ